MSVASDYVTQFLNQRTDEMDIGMNLAIVQHSPGLSQPGIAGYASSPSSTPGLGPPRGGRSGALVTLQFASCPLYFSDRRSGNSGPFSGQPDTVDVAISTAGRFDFPDGLAHLSIRNESCGGRTFLSATSLDAQTRQLVFEGPGAGNVGFMAMYIVSFFPSPIPG